MERIINQKDNTGRTALMDAANGRCVDAVPHLLPGADVYARDLDGKTVLELARAAKNEVAAELLLSAMQGGRSRSSRARTRVEGREVDTDQPTIPIRWK